MADVDMDKALELAKKVVALSIDETCAGCDPDCMCSERREGLIARALIACRKPVDVIDGGKDFDLCGNCNEQLIAETFCPNCGRPLNWRKA